MKSCRNVFRLSDWRKPWFLSFTFLKSSFGSVYLLLYVRYVTISILWSVAEKEWDGGPRFYLINTTIQVGKESGRSWCGSKFQRDVTIRWMPSTGLRTISLDALIRCPSWMENSNLRSRWDKTTFSSKMAYFWPLTWNKRVETSAHIWKPSCYRCSFEVRHWTVWKRTDGDRRSVPGGTAPVWKIPARGKRKGCGASRKWAGQLTRQPVTCTHLQDEN